MRTKNLTPFPFGFKHCSRRPPEREMTFIVRGKFTLKPGQPLTPARLAIELPDGLESADLDEAMYALGQGPLSAETYREEDEERTGELLYPGDFADFKLGAEVMLRGTCHPRRPVPECDVGFTVGDRSWKLRVFGPRVWVDRLGGGHASAPVAFHSMPLDWTHAFGGADYPDNPVGKGLTRDALPNLELEKGRIRATTDRPVPASFGPVNPAWPLRARKVGMNYGATYEKTRAPYFPDDFDWSHFHAAPAAQQLPHYLRGDEAMRFENLHPSSADFESRLPGLRVRVFVRDAGDGMRAIAMSLDTLFVSMDEGLLYLTWRGVTPVAEDDLSDVKFALIASEPLAEKPLPDQVYFEQLAAFARDPVGLEGAFPEGFDEAKARFDAEEDAPFGAAPPEAPADELVVGKLGTIGKGPAQDVGPLLAANRETLATPEGKRALRDAQVQGRSGGVTAGLPMEPGGKLRIGLSSVLGDALRQLAPQRAAAAEATPGRADPLAGLAAVRAVDPKIKLDPGDAPPEEPGPGRDLSGQDFTGRDLSGLDLTEANLEAANLTGANLAGTCLVKANLRMALFYKADLTGADLTGADMTGADLGLAKMGSANLTETKLDMAVFRKTDLRGAKLSGARGMMPSFTNAKMCGAVAVGLSVEKGSFEEVDLEGADLSESKLVRTLFVRCKAKGIKLERAVLDHTSFMESDLNGAKLERARGETTIWLRANLDGADLSRTALQGGQFSEVSGRGARFGGANLRDARFYRAGLEMADLTGANLFAGDLRKATLTKARFGGSNLYDAKFMEASGTEIDFSGANLERANFRHSKLGRA